MRRRLVAAAVALLVAACQPSVAPVDVTDPRVAVGSARSCAELGMSDIRCTLLTLRATKDLDAARPGHVAVASQQFHEAGSPPAGQSAIPTSQVVAAVLVFTLTDGTRVGVPILCPREPSGSDPACNPQVQ